MAKNNVTLKTGLAVVQVHWKWMLLKIYWKWRRLIDHIRLSIGPPL